MKSLVAVLMLILILMGAGSALGEEKVKIGYLRLTISLPTFVAAEKALFEQEGSRSSLSHSSQVP